MNYHKKLSFLNDNKQHLIITLELKEDKLQRPVFTASGQLYEDFKMISGGQCLNCIPEFIQAMKSKKEINKLNTIYELWKKYHLNDTKVWCKHMNYGEFPKNNIKIHHLYGNNEYKKINRIREVPPAGVKVSEQGLSNIPKALYNYLEYDKQKGKHIETEYAGHLTYDPVFCPEGLIGRECPICGKKYGHEWFYMPIPENALKKIKNIINK